MIYLFIYHNGKVEEWQLERVGASRRRFYRNGDEFFINTNNYEEFMRAVKDYKKIKEIRMKYV